MNYFLLPTVQTLNKLIGIVRNLSKTPFFKNINLNQVSPNRGWMVHSLALF